MHVLLINPPMYSPAEHAAFSGLSPHLGLGYLAASLLRNGASVSVLDLALAADPERQLDAVMAELRPGLVGITSITQSFHLAVEVSHRVKRLQPETFLVMGGPHVSYLWEEVLAAEQQIDALALFEAEDSIVELLREVAGGTPQLAGINGIAYRKEGKPVRTRKRPPIEDLDRLALPARHLLPMSVYGRPGTIMTSRGCPEKCIFCISSIYEGSYRTRSAASVITELEELRWAWGIREVYFVDNVFTVNRDRVQEICEQMIRRRLGLRFHCVSRADLVTSELIGLLKAAGCERIEIGVESGSQKVIDGVGKHLSLQQVRQAADIVLGMGLIPMFTFQLGSPFDTEADLQATRSLAGELRARGAMTFFSIMTPFPGTQLVKQAKKLGITVRAASWQEYRTSNPIYDTATISRHQLRRALYEEYALQTQERQRLVLHPKGSTQK